MTAPIANPWSRIVAWLQKASPEDRSRLQSGVPAPTLDQTASRLGVPLPEGFRALYQLMNGTDPEDESVGLFPSHDEWDEMPFGPLALEQIVDEWEMQKELLEGGDFADRVPETCDATVKNEWWNVQWIPFASNGGGDYYCLDMAPTELGTVGQVITHSHESGEHHLLAPSLLAFLNELANALEAGTYEFCEDGVQAIATGA